jgi:hypothetical protein
MFIFPDTFLASLIAASLASAPLFVKNTLLKLCGNLSVSS